MIELIKDEPQFLSRLLRLLICFLVIALKNKAVEEDIKFFDGSFQNYPQETKCDSN